MMKLTSIGALSALKEIDRCGMIWSGRSYEAPLTWAALKRRGWIEKDKITGKNRITDAGRSALAAMEEKTQ